ncbi:NAD(+) diphosphatase [Acanthopleuribacter pedis]|uniref:NAD(+) diphosphatase n=1 Tax=Acanthopleuribacter pedis TaxID=442870 RepID=A0A8J7QBA1_9BACT|nr:NAD(+) diphosphatase [Acanthopleuribacter pedis]MBO1322381.1 NAD(+) diphosphatase [Acanthopleuribacter pedis]
MKDVLYTLETLDRAAHLREDQPWLAARLRDPESRFVLQRGTDLWLIETDPARVAHALSEDVSGTRPIFLGLRDKRAVFALDCDRDPVTPPGPGAWHGLRSVVAQLAPDQATAAAYARAMVFWQRAHRFCGRCGGPLSLTHAGHVGRCTVARCGAQIFPRTDAAVIMLVEYQPAHGPPHCLLGRGTTWPEGRFSTLAGFLEPGESLEQAVRREVQEEAGIAVGAVDYLASQPWPFPSSLMVGFRARALTRDIQLDPKELAEAAWYTPAETEAYLARTPERANSGSISTRLIQHWLAEQREAGWL